MAGPSRHGRLVCWSPGYFAQGDFVSLPTIQGVCVEELCVHGRRVWTSASHGTLVFFVPHGTPVLLSGVHGQGRCVNVCNEHGFCVLLSNVQGTTVSAAAQGNCVPEELEHGSSVLASFGQGIWVRPCFGPSRHGVPVFDSCVHGCRVSPPVRHGSPVDPVHPMEVLLPKKHGCFVAAVHGRMLIPSQQGYKVAATIAQGSFVSEWTWQRGPVDGWKQVGAATTCPATLAVAPPTQTGTCVACTQVRTSVQTLSHPDDGPGFRTSIIRSFTRKRGIETPLSKLQERNRTRHTIQSPSATMDLAWTPGRELLAAARARTACAPSW